MSSMFGNLSDRSRLRARMIRNLKPAPCLPTQYAKGSKDTDKKSTQLDPSKVDSKVVPKRYTLHDKDEMIMVVLQWYNAFLDSDQFPTRLFHEQGIFALQRPFIMSEAENIRPSGESGVSHYLKPSLFDPLNYILHEYYHGPFRYWAPIGIGATGKMDWGLYVNGILVLIVELKPQRVVSGHDMRGLINLVADGENRTVEIVDGWANASEKAKNIGFQMYGGFALETARPHVKYAVILNETVRDDGGIKYASAVLFERRADHIAIADQLFDDGTVRAPGKELLPIELLLALSLEPEPLRDPPAFAPPPTPVRTSRQGDSTSLDKKDLKRVLRSGSQYGREGVQPVPSHHPTTTPSGLGSLRGPSGSGISGGNTGGSVEGRRGGARGGAGFQRSGKLEESPGVVNTPDTQVGVQRSPSKVKPTGLSVAPRFESYNTIIVDGDISSGDSSVEIEADIKDILDHSYEDSITSTPPTSPLPLEIDLAETNMGSLHLTAVNLALGGGALPLNELNLKGPLDWTSTDPRVFLPVIRGHSQSHPTSTTVTELNSECGSGAVWTAFRVHSRQSFQDSPKIIKFACPQLYPEFSETDYDVEGVSCAIKRELDILTGPLRRLQGELVPTLRGIYVGKTCEKAIWAVIMDDGGNPLNVDLALYHVKLEVIKKYRLLHQALVLHNDSNPRNWLQEGNKRIFIIDFERAQTRSAFSDEVAWQAACKDELESVAHALGLLRVPDV